MKDIYIWLIPRIRTLKLGGYEPLKKYVFRFYQGLNIICGANGVGKTRLIKAITDTFENHAPKTGLLKPSRGGSMTIGKPNAKLTLASKLVKDIDIKNINKMKFMGLGAKKCRLEEGQLFYQSHKVVIPAEICCVMDSFYPCLKISERKKILRKLLKKNVQLILTDTDAKKWDKTPARFFFLERMSDGFTKVRVSDKKSKGK